MFSVCAQISLRKTKFFNLVGLIGIDNVQTTMSESTLYLFAFSSYMQKTKHVFGLFTKWDQLARKENLAKNVETRAQTQAPLGQKVHDPRANPGAPD